MELNGKKLSAHGIRLGSDNEPDFIRSIPVKEKYFRHIKHLKVLMIEQLLGPPEQLLKMLYEHYEIIGEEGQLDNQLDILWDEIDYMRHQINSQETNLPRLLFNISSTEGLLIKKISPQTDFFHRGSLLRGKLKNTVLNYITDNFSNEYESLWHISFKIIEIEWEKFLEDEARKFTRSRWAFEFYWTIFKEFEFLKNQFEKNPLSGFETILFEPDDEYRVIDSYRWLKSKCEAHHIKLKTDLSEPQLFQELEKWTAYVAINDINQFVRSYFQHRDSHHDIWLYTDKIQLQESVSASEFIRFFKNEIDAGLLRSTGAEPHKAIEIRLWLEFVFRGVDGFTYHTIEKIFSEDGGLKVYGKK